MKRFVAFAVAALSFVVSSIQAAEAKFVFYTELADQSVRAAKEAHFGMVDADGQKVYDVKFEEDANAAVVDVEPGKYSIVLEESKTGYAGSVEVVVEEKNNARFYLLSKRGLEEMEGVHECPEEHELDNNGKGHVDCDCDDNCICRYVCEKCSPEGAAAANVVPPTPVPQSGAGFAGAGAGAGATAGSMGGLGMLGMIGGMTAAMVTAVATKNTPASTVATE